MNYYSMYFRRDAVVFRETVNCPTPLPSSDNILSQTDVLTSDVPYSLNKRGRWTLPGDLRLAILTGELRREEFGVQLIELHKINKTANCVAVYASRGPLGKVAIQKRKNSKRRKKTGYMQATSIINAKPYGTSKRRRRQYEHRGRGDSTNDENTGSEEPSQIRYEVVYPSPITSSVTHNPKYIGYDTTKSKSRSGHKKHRKKHCHDLLLEDMFDMDDRFDDPEEEDCNHGYEQSCRDMQGNTISFQELITDASQVRQKSHREKLSERALCQRSVEGNETSKKTKIFYNCIKDEQQSTTFDSDDNVTNGTPTKDDRILSEPVRVYLQNDEVDEHSLLQKYNESYIESNCFPRKFVIDISEMISQTKITQNRWKYCPDKLQACVVFVLDRDNEANTNKEQIYKVYLNIPVHEEVNSIKIETLFDYMETTIDDCIARSIFFMETLSHLLKLSTSSTVYNKTVQSTTGAIANWRVLSYLPNDSFVYRKFLATSQRQRFETVQGKQVTDDLNTMDESENVSSLNDRFCGICYDSLGPEVTSTALKQCGHWFCDICWREYLENEVGSGAISLTCPEFDCNTAVDAGTVMSLLNIKDVIKHAKFCHDTQVEQQVATKWCPNVKCGRVIQVNSEKAETVNCACGQNLCFKCNGKSHWPAACQSVKLYNAEVKRLGLDNVESEGCGIHSVNGRNCPFCKRFVEKNGGCPFMYCICRNSFCWGCGKPWSSGDHGPCSRGHKNVHGGTVKRQLKVELKQSQNDNDGSNSKAQRLFDIAVRHRLEQNREKIKEMKVSVKELGKKLNCFVTRSASIRDAVVMQVPTSAERPNDERATDMNSFLNQMISLYTEINQTAEYTAVLLMDISSTDSNLHKFLKCILSRFQNFSIVIHESIMYGHHCQPRDVITRLNDVQQHSVTAFRALLKRTKAMHN